MTEAGRLEYGSRLAVAGSVLLIVSVLTHFWWTEQDNPWSDKIGLRSTVECHANGTCETKRLSGDGSVVGTVAYFGALGTSSLLVVGVVMLGLRRRGTPLMWGAIGAGLITFVCGLAFLRAGKPQFAQYQLGASAIVFILGCTAALGGAILLLPRRA